MRALRERGAARVRTFAPGIDGADESPASRFAVMVFMTSPRRSPAAYNRTSTT
jgi:hypothetical protein